MFFGGIRYIRHLYTSGAGSFALKNSFSNRIFRFSCQAIVSLLCEWSSAIRISAATVIAPYWEPKGEPMQMLFWRNNIEAGHTPSPGGSILLSGALFTCSRFGAIFLNRILSNNRHKQ
jgi:hypothetical protein